MLFKKGCHSLSRFAHIPSHLLVRKVPACHVAMLHVVEYLVLHFYSLLPQGLNHFSSFHHIRLVIPSWQYKLRAVHFLHNVELLFSKVIGEMHTGVPADSTLEFSRHTGLEHHPRTPASPCDGQVSHPLRLQERQHLSEQIFAHCLPLELGQPVQLYIHSHVLVVEPRVLSEEVRHYRQEVLLSYLVSYFFRSPSFEPVHVVAMHHCLLPFSRHIALQIFI